MVMQLSQGRLDLELPDFLLGRVEILGQAVAVVDEDAGLQLVDHAIQRLAVVVFGALAQAIEPEDVHGAVVGQQFAHLGLQVGEVVRVPVGKGIGVVPVRLRVVEPEAQAGAVAGSGQFFDDVPMEWAVGGGDLVAVRLGVEFAEAVVVPAGEDEVFHAGGLGDGHPRVRIEIGGIEVAVEIVINLDGDLRAVRPVAAPLAAARPTDLGALEADRPPVDEQAKARLAPPVEPLGARGRAGSRGGGFRLAGVE